MDPKKDNIYTVQGLLELDPAQMLAEDLIKLEERIVLIEEALKFHNLEGPEDGR